MNEDAISRSEIMKREIGKIQDESETLTIQLQRVQEEVHKNKEMRRQEIFEIRRKETETQPTVPQELQMPDVAPNTPPVEFIMTEFEKHKQDKDKWFSEPFYTHPRGYKLRLHVHANGSSKGKNTHVSVGVCLMQGDFDNDLSWPFCGDVSITLLNQKDQQNSECQTVRFSEVNSDVNNRVIAGESAPHARLINQFLPHSQLGHNPAKSCQFLKDNCLHFMVTQIVLLKPLQRLEMNQVAVKEQCLAIESCVCLPPFQFTMRDFEEKKTNADEWYSPTFYTHPRGYRMCLRVHANGYGSGEDTHLSVYVFLMKGEWDNYLQWPFRGNITVQLLNQIQDKGHREYTTHFTDTTSDDCAGRVTIGERSATGRGWPRFISHEALSYDPTENCQYSKYNCLQFRIVKVELKT